MRNIRLITLDLDGTLLDSDKRLSAENAAALARAAQAGIEIVPATGRFYRAMPEVIRKLPFVRYVITVNGASVYDIQNAKTVCASELTWRQAVSVMERLDSLPVIYDCYQDGWGWMSQAFYDRAADFAASEHSLRLLRDFRTPVPELKACLRQRASGVQKVSVFFRDMALRERMLAQFPQEFPDLTVTTSIVNNIEFNSREATKGTALRKLAAYLRVPAAQTMAFGDDLNDVTMLQSAGIGVAMGNAADAAKRAADYVADDCDHSGVAHALQHFLWEESE